MNAKSEVQKIRKGQYDIRANSSNYEYFWGTFADDSWEPETFRIFDRFTDPKSTYLDIGSWIGPTVLYGAQNSRKVVAIEPDLKAYNELVANVELNPEVKDRIVAKNIAITKESGSFKLFADNFAADSTSTLVSAKAGKDYYIVDGVTFADLIKEFPIEDVSFIKIDVEGSEYSLIPTMRDILKNLEKRPAIYLSLHPPFLTPKYPENKILREFARIKRRIKTRYLTRRLINNLGFYKYFYDINGKLIKNRKSLGSINDFHSVVISDEAW